MKADKKKVFVRTETFHLPIKSKIFADQTNKTSPPKSKNFYLFIFFLIFTELFNKNFLHWAGA